MNTTRPCGCKGHRTCLRCELIHKIPTSGNNIKKSPLKKLVYCLYCNLCYPNEDPNSYKSHPNHKGEAVKLEGLYIQEDFITEEEHDTLMQNIDSMPWDVSQSGRRKQNFGPKTNFKGRKLRLGNFSGFPAFSKFVQQKFEEVPLMQGFQTIEQCSLDYDPKRGSSIEPHVDDCWVWGERVVTVNLLSDSVLTLTPNEHLERYNLDLVKTYPPVLGGFGNLVSAVIFVPMPRKSLIIMYGSARYDYEHRVVREDVKERRVCLAYREFTPIFLDGGECYQEGKVITEKAKKFYS
ncbi:alpha-ketoglutarate-dependent dioxygenase alkB homolog 4 [Euwallacea fornicatus]|uniref:alpha-ketoglutarate-dependent dioxygenase alkB homolog 4 n=1 Tax=Euwallacea fornicatus TaxID=995702 RepID=UPI00338E8A3F